MYNEQRVHEVFEQLSDLHSNEKYRKEISLLRLGYGIGVGWSMVIGSKG